MSAMMEESPRRHLITVDEYHRMGETDILGPDARVELIEGEIIDMPPMGPPHGAEITVLNQLLVRAVGDLAIVRCQLPILLDERSEPVPDFVLVKPRADFYSTRHPNATDTLLIVEVSHTTLRYDRKVKVPLYARHLVPEVWIVDIRGEQIHFFRSPADGQYAHASTTRPPASTALSALPGVTVDLSQVLRGRPGHLASTAD